MNKFIGAKVFLTTFLTYGVVLGSIASIILVLTLGRSVEGSFVYLLLGFSLAFLLGLVIGTYMFIELSWPSMVSFQFSDRVAFLNELTHELGESNIIPVKLTGSTVVYKYSNVFFEIPIQLELAENKGILSVPRGLLSSLRSSYITKQ